MAELQYIGARYVPKFFEGANGSEWLANTQYEALTIVTRNGNSYTSKIPVPGSVGAPENNPTYWVSTGIYNEQIGRLTNELNELEERVAETEKDAVAVESAPVNILLLGGKNDGSEDIGAIINQYTALHDIYLPCGEYLVTTPIVLQHSLIGAHGNQYYANGCTLINSMITSGSVISVLENTTPKAITIKGFNLNCNDYPVTGINFTPSVRVYLNLSDVCVLKARIAYNFAPTVAGSRIVMAHNFGAFGSANYDTAYNSIGIRLSNCHDSALTDFYILGYSQAINNINVGGLRITSCHLYCANGAFSGEQKKNLFRVSMCVNNNAGNIIADNVYLDTALQYWVQRADHAMIGNVIAWNDGFFDETGDTDANIFSTRNNGRIDIDNLIVGGSRTTIGGIVFPRFVTLNKFTILWDTYISNNDAILASNLRTGTKGIYNEITNSNRVVEVARVHCKSNGIVHFTYGFGSNETEVVVRINSVGDVASVTILRETAAARLYYKMDGWDCVFYRDYGSAESRTIPTWLNINSSAGDNNGLIDYDAYPALTRATQNDTTGLTQLTA